MPMNLPNVLTLCRIGLIPVFAVFFFLPLPWANEIAAGLFALAAVTDWLDGYLARRMNLTSAFGAFLDPVADKLMVAVALIALLVVHPSPFMALLVAVIIGREIAVSALREWMAEIGKRATVQVNMIGKVKTAVQMTAILLLIQGQPIGWLPSFEVGFGLLLVAAGLTLWSMVVYLRAALQVIRDDR